MRKPRLAITMGDPAGVGPETIVGAWKNGGVHEWCRPLVIGRPQVMRRAVELLGGGIEVVEAAAPDQVESQPGCLPCLVAGPPEADAAPDGVVSCVAGEAAYQALTAAARLAVAGEVDGVVTAPLNKAALWAAGHTYPGHTELLAELCGAPDVAMMLYLAPGAGICGRAGLGVVHVTLHMALKDAIAAVTTDAVAETIHLAGVGMSALIGEAIQREPPRIGVCALNPHAGEQGLFGDEEQQIIAPAVLRAVGRGIDAVGPLPADALLVDAAEGEFDAVVAMYHDQGHIALKLLGMHRAVNITLGLPIVRTSVAHGTAFDLAWRGAAESSSMVEAIRTACLLIENRRFLVWQ